MATIKGSGKFVAIAASNTQFDDLMTNKIYGVVFGSGNYPYCRISSKYTTNSSGTTVTGTALCIDAGKSGNALYLEFPAVQALSIFPADGTRDEDGYTGSLNVVHDVALNNQTLMFTVNYKTYNFKCGLLLNV